MPFTGIIAKASLGELSSDYFYHPYGAWILDDFFSFV